MFSREPSKARFWRLEDELIELGVWEEETHTDSEDESDTEDDSVEASGDELEDLSEGELWLMEQMEYGGI